MVTFEIQKGYFTVWDGKTAYNMFILEGTTRETYSYLPELDVVYAYCQAHKLTPEQTIDFMLKVFHRQRLFKFGYLADLSVVVGFVGPRGSGKSVGACAHAVIDYLLDGKTVWSNMNIELKVKYRDCEKIFRSEPLDKASLMDINEFESKYADGLVMIDELNIEIGDSRRSMTNSMLWFDFMLQEVRKRKMNICYQLQAEEWAGSRSRWQTDIYVSCRDAAFLSGKPTRDTIGRKSRWRLHDMSGIITGEIKFSDGFRNKVDWFGETYFWNTPFWNVYDTGQMQAYRKFDPTKTSKEGEAKITLDAEALERLGVKNMVDADVPKVLVQLVNKLSGETVSRTNIYNVLGVTDHKQKSEIGAFLRAVGFEDGPRSAAGERSYILPDKDTLVEKLNNLGVSVLQGT